MNTGAAPVKKGDVNGDNFVDLKDAMLILQVDTLSNPANIQIGADTNQDGVLALEDVVYILQDDAGLRE